MSLSPLEQAIANFPTQVAFAEAMGLRSPSVSEWLRRGVPIERCPAIEQATAGKVRCEFLRDDVEWTRDHDGRVTGYHVRVTTPHIEPALPAKVA